MKVNTHGPLIPPLQFCKSRTKQLFKPSWALLLLLAFGTAANASAKKPETEKEMKAVQPITITGKVTDSSGMALSGVSVVLKGTKTGVLTDASGNYSLSLAGQIGA